MFDAARLRPMLATLASAPPSMTDERLVYEPKYDGIRAIVLLDPAAGARFWSRLGNEKTRQFPDLVAGFAEWARKARRTLVIDGEIVALDPSGRPGGFQRLQSRIHVTVPGYRSSKPLVGATEQPTAFIAFDLLRDGAEDLRALKLTDRRARLERLFEGSRGDAATIRLSEQSAGDGRELRARAEREGWEGLLVKHASSPYRDGRRSPEWLKVKLTKQDEFVVGGWTEPKGARSRFGSLILGRFDEAGQLIHAGDVGTGFTTAELDRVWALLAPLQSETSPFASRPKTLGRPHWVEPVLVAQVRFVEETDDGRLRHPAYLGLRNDKRARDVTLPPSPSAPVSSSSSADRTRKSTRSSSSASPNATSVRGRRAKPELVVARAPKRRRTGAKAQADTAVLEAWQPAADAMSAQLTGFEEQKRDGRLLLPDGDSLDVTNLQKVFWPAARFTKGDLLRFYARIAPLLLPVVEDRPLVMKRFPNGVEQQSFYQHRAPDIFPPGVRVEAVPEAEAPTMFVGGALKTLLYMTQLASISQDPWFSKVQATQDADVVALDLDPQPGATFRQIQDVALWVHDELERLRVPSFAKTSGAEGIHIFIPLPDGTSYETGVLFCQIVATMVVTKHPKVATIERMVKRRPDKTIYVDYLQNIVGKTLACAYSARASAFAGVSTPLAWREIDGKISPQDFTIKTVEARVREAGDLWAGLRTSPPADLEDALQRLRA